MLKGVSKKFDFWLFKVVVSAFCVLSAFFYVLECRGGERGRLHVGTTWVYTSGLSGRQEFYGISWEDKKINCGLCGGT